MKNRPTTTAAPLRKLTVSLLASAWLLAAGVVPAGAVPVLDTTYGDPAVFSLPEVNAMGGTGAACFRGGVSNVFNPAFLVRATGTRIDGALSFEQEHEDRFTPLFDSFDSYVTDTAIASNRHHYLDSGFALAHRLLAGPQAVAVGLSLTDRYSYKYDFEEEIRDPDSFSSPRDRLLQERALLVDGVLRALSGGVAVAVSPRLSFGASLHYAFGTRAQTRLERDYQEPTASLIQKEDFDLTGCNLTLGGRLAVGQRFEFGLAWESPLDAAGNILGETYFGAYPDSVQVTTGHGHLQYPGIWRGGLTYRPRSDPRTVFTVDAVYAEWSDLEDSRLPQGEQNPRLEDTVDFRVGVQHTFYNGVPVRFGFRHLDSYSDREAGAIFFTGGIGMPTSAGLISFSVEMTKLSSVQGHLFDYPLGFVAAPEARVDDTRFRVGVGFSRSF